jgi:hypothetical protein
MSSPENTSGRLRLQEVLRARPLKGRFEQQNQIANWKMGNSAKYTILLDVQLMK